MNYIGLLAKYISCLLFTSNVKKVYIGSEPDFWELYIQQKNKISEVQLTEKKHGKYGIYTISKKYKNVFPQAMGNLAIDKKNNVLFSGITTCGFFVNHVSKKQCNKAYHFKHPYNDIIIETNVKKAWGNNDMFAYVKNNKLFITGRIMGELVGKGDEKCYKYNTCLLYTSKIILKKPELLIICFFTKKIYLVMEINTRFCY